MGQKWINPNGNVFLWSVAGQYIGQTGTIQGIIVYTYVSSKGTVFLDFHYPYQGYFYAVIFVGDLSNFRFQPSSFYLNKDVRITGTIQLSPYNGAPEIIVRSPSQIEVAYIGFNYP
jgi:micrococcal nuclease